MLRLFQSTLPRRERRQCICFLVTSIIISIHAPTKGATIYPSSYKIYVDISIHAPTKGATKRAVRFDPYRPYFNPRSHEGSDKPLTTTPIDFHHFNPRSHEGSDDNKISYYKLFYNFNPRSHEGSDFRSCTKSLANFLFQSTLPRRERRKLRQEQQRAIRFQSTLPRRERPCSMISPSFITNFNPRSHEGSDIPRSA